MLTVSEADKPALHLQTTANMKMRFQLHEQSLFWARIIKGYYGVNVLKALPATTLPVTTSPINDAEQQIVPPISSAEIEANQRHYQQEYFAAWSRYFANALKQSSNTLLHDGEWLMLAYQAELVGSEPSSWVFRNADTQNKFNLGPIRNVDAALTESPLLSIDWGLNGNNDLIGLYSPAGSTEQRGRWKWWCKKAREGTLPPILIWFVGGLSSFIILDGHLRLRAAIDENVPPTFIVLYHGIHVEHELSDKTLESQQALLKQMAHQHAQGNMQTEQINDVLIAAFHPHDYYRNTTLAWGGMQENDWDEQVIQQLQALEITDNITDSSQLLG